MTAVVIINAAEEGGAAAGATPVELTGGYVRLYRKLLQNPIWTQLAPAVLKVAIYFILRANWKAGQWYDGTSSLAIPAGSFVTSYAKTAAACNLSVQQIRDAFDHLGRTGFATYRRTHRWTLVTVINYELYQATCDDENTPENTEENSCGNRKGTLNEEVKNKEIHTCASVGLLSIDNPPFETTEPDGLFPVQPANGTKPKRAATDEQERWFSEWWSEYWRGKSKQAARQAFQKHIKIEAEFQQVMAATRAQKPEMLDRDISKRPYGSSWLNRGEWLDVPERAVQPRNGKPAVNLWRPPKPPEVAR